MKNTFSRKNSFSKWGFKNKTFLPRKELPKTKNFQAGSIPQSLADVNNSNLSTVFCPSGLAFNAESLMYFCLMIQRFNNILILYFFFKGFQKPLWALKLKMKPPTWRHFLMKAVLFNL
jgi:hypothetical protein